jgi:hypothetical protein
LRAVTSFAAMRIAGWIKVAAVNVKWQKPWFKDARIASQPCRKSILNAKYLGLTRDIEVSLPQYSRGSTFGAETP